MNTFNFCKKKYVIVKPDYTRAYTSQAHIQQHETFWYSKNRVKTVLEAVKNN